MIGPARCHAFAHLPTDLSVRPRKMSAKSFLLYNFPATVLFAAGCTRNYTYVAENKDLRVEGGTPPSAVTSSHFGNFSLQWSADFFNIFNHPQFGEIIFVPRSKSRKSKRYVGITERVKAALMARNRSANEGWVFPSARSASGHIETVQKQFNMAKRMAGIPESIVLYCARHRFSTDTMEGTGNLRSWMQWGIARWT